VLDVAQALLGERGGGDLDQLAGTGAAVAATSTRPGAVAVDGAPIAAAVTLATSSARSARLGARQRSARGAAYADDISCTPVHGVLARMFLKLLDRGGRSTLADAPVVAVVLSPWAEGAAGANGS
jgi:hypothetical protein